MRRGTSAHLPLVALMCALLLPATAMISPSLSSQRSPGPAYQNTSWALGIVVPEGATLQGGGKLRWDGAWNVTASLTLPNISMPDRVTYTVLSMMTNGGSVLQVAAGIRPNDGVWFAYSWMIPDVESVPLTYTLILNASGPGMAPEANITLALFYASGSWNLKVKDLDTGDSLVHAFPPGLGTSPKAGDQELFSFESYSRLGATFRRMGNLTLRSLLVNGAKVMGETYSYSEWDPSHTPLFAVGSSGTSPPSFISFGQSKDGSFVWGYETAWGNESNSSIVVMEMIAVLMLVFLGTLGAVLWKTRTPASRSFQN